MEKKLILKHLLLILTAARRLYMNLKTASIITMIITEIIHFIFAIIFVGIMAILTKYGFSWKTVICIYLVIDWIRGLQNSYELLRVEFLIGKFK